MPLLTAEQILKEIDLLSPQEKDTLYLLLDKEEQQELLSRMSLDRKMDIDEKQLFD